MITNSPLILRSLYDGGLRPASDCDERSETESENLADKIWTGIPKFTVHIEKLVQWFTYPSISLGRLPQATPRSLPRLP